MPAIRGIKRRRQRNTRGSQETADSLSCSVICLWIITAALVIIIAVVATNPDPQWQWKFSFDELNSFATPAAMTNLRAPRPAPPESGECKPAVDAAVREAASLIRKLTEKIDELERQLQAQQHQ